MNPTPERQQYSSGTPWEESAGYSRALRVDNRVFVAGTTASNPEGRVMAVDPAGQTRFILDKIDTAMTALGSSLRDTVRIRIFVRDITDWEAVAAVLGERFRDIKPVSTLVEARLIRPEFLVEIEVEAIIGAGDAL